MQIKIKFVFDRQNVLVVQRTLLHKYILDVEVYLFNAVFNVFSFRKDRFKVNLVYLLRQHKWIVRYI